MTQKNFPRIGLVEVRGTGGKKGEEGVRLHHTTTTTTTIKSNKVKLSFKKNDDNNNKIKVSVC